MLEAAARCLLLLLRGGLLPFVEEHRIKGSATTPRRLVGVLVQTMMYSLNHRGIIIAVLRENS